MKIVKTLLAGLGTVVLMAGWVVFACFMSLYGWWMKPASPAGDHDAFLAQATAMIEENPQGNAALVLIEDGEVVGSLYEKPSRNVGPDTLFPTASFSKWIAAMGVMSLVEEGRIDLDAPVSTYLKRWQLPETVFDNDQVTVRRLLSHTSGLTDGLGFGEYAADEPVPSLEDSLARPRASSGEEVQIAAGAAPGDFAYSGGGYLILELMIEDVTGEDYADFTRQRLLGPLGMERSTFGYIGGMPDVTASFDETGAEMPHARYASAAATGFSTTAADLTRLVQAILEEKASFPLTPATLREMRTPEATVLGTGIWGLGTILYAPAGEGDHVFGHDGANDPAVNSSVRINPESGDAFIMLVTGHRTLASDVGAEWVLWQTGVPDIFSTEAALKSAFWPSVIGAVLILLLVVACGRVLRRR